VIQIHGLLNSFPNLVSHLDELLSGGFDQNLYRYVLNSPINQLDPLGLDGWPTRRPKPRKKVKKCPPPVYIFLPPLVIPPVAPPQIIPNDMNSGRVVDAIGIPVSILSPFNPAAGIFNAVSPMTAGVVKAIKDWWSGSTP